MGVAEWNLGLGKVSAQSSGYGGFTGYNSQWNDVVLGLEMSYLHGNFGGQTSATEARSSVSALADGNFHDVTATSAASISISDMATFRGRAAYAFGCFLPYLFGGFALGNADISRSINVQDVVSPTQFGRGTALAPLNTTDLMSNHLIYGYTAGARHRHQSDRRPLHASRMGICSVYRPGRYQHQYRARRPRLQILTEAFAREGGGIR